MIANNITVIIPSKSSSFGKTYNLPENIEIPDSNKFSWEAMLTYNIYIRLKAQGVKDINIDDLLIVSFDRA